MPWLRVQVVVLGRQLLSASLKKAAISPLTLDEAAYITGQTLFIDGGLTLFADFRQAWSA